MDTVTIGSPKVPSLATRRVKCTPVGVRWGGALPPTPQSLAFVLRVGFLFLDVHAPSEQMGEPVPMDGADDIEHSGLSEDLREQKTSVLWSSAGRDFIPAPPVPSCRALSGGRPEEGKAGWR